MIPCLDNKGIGSQDSLDREHVFKMEPKQLFIFLFIPCNHAITMDPY